MDDLRLRELWEEVNTAASLPSVPDSLQVSYAPGNYRAAEEMAGLIPEVSIAAALTGDPDSALAAVRGDSAVHELVRQVALGDLGQQKFWTQLENDALVLMEALCLAEEGGVRYSLSYREENGCACSMGVMFSLPVGDVPQVQDQGRLNSFVYGLGESAGYLYHGAFSGWQRVEDWYARETAAAQNDVYHGERFIEYQDSTHQYYYENGQPVPYYDNGTGKLHCGRVQLEDGEIRYRGSTIDGATRPCQFA